VPGFFSHFCDVAEVANHPQESLSKFGYEQHMKFKKKKKTVEASFLHFWLEEPNREIR
jgi:hypothetical protein